MMGLDGVCGVLTRGKCRVFTKNWPKKKKANKRASDDQHLGGPSRLPANEANCPADFCRQVGSRVRGMLSKWFQSCLFRTCMRRLGESPRLSVSYAQFNVHYGVGKNQLLLLTVTALLVLPIYSTFGRKTNQVPAPYLCEPTHTQAVGKRWERGPPRYTILLILVQVRYLCDGTHTCLLERVTRACCCTHA